jgi:hypothetical protein
MRLLASNFLPTPGNPVATCPPSPAAFYEGKVAAAQFFARTVLPKLAGERAIAGATDLSLMDLDEAAF